MKQFTLVTLCAVTILVSTHAPHVAGQDRSRVDAIVNINNQFALELYRELAKDAPMSDGNLFYSPFGVSTVLAMTYAGARGDTERQMATVLGFPSNDEKLHSDEDGSRHKRITETVTRRFTL